MCAVGTVWSTCVFQFSDLPRKPFLGTVLGSRKWQSGTLSLQRFVFAALVEQNQTVFHE